MGRSRFDTSTHQDYVNFISQIILKDKPKYIKFSNTGDGEQLYFRTTNNKMNFNFDALNLHLRMYGTRYYLLR